VELLAVVAIVGVVLSLLLPAMQSANHAARRVQCLNNLRQLSLGAFNYQQQYEMFPPGYITHLAPDGSEVGPGWGWAPQMLPDLEQSMVHMSIDFGAPILAPANGTAVACRMSTMLCPGSRPGTDVPIAVRDGAGKVLSEALPPASYVGCSGTPGEGDGPDPDDGMFVRNKWILPDHVLDGLSHTLMFGERSRALADTTWTGAVPGGWLCTNPGHPRRDCRPSGAMVLGRSGPAGRRPAFNAPEARADEFWGGHPEGANFAIADGSCRFVSDSIDPAVFRAMATRAGAEMLDR
jgi:hypothetical protein